VTVEKADVRILTDLHAFRSLKQENFGGGVEVCMYVCMYVCMHISASLAPERICMFH
jgi:hypothetical protein